MADRSKDWEKRVMEQWKKTVPDSFMYRLYDTTFGYKSIANISDYIAYKYPYIYCIEVKCHEGPRFPFSAFRQYEKMLDYKGISGVKLGVILWMIDYQKVFWIPLETFIKIYSEGHKSFNIKMSDNPEYEVLDLKAKNLRTFMSVDFNNLINYYKEGANEGN